MQAGSKRILILTEPGDLHAYAVAEALKAKGAEALLWHTPDFPTVGRESVLFGTGAMDVSVEGPDFHLPKVPFDSIWRRRPSHVLAEELHPADREFANMECGLFRKALFRLLSPGAFWVNPPEAAIRSGLKLFQHRLAQQAGLTAPVTLYSNDPEAIRLFISEQGGKVVYKPFRGAAWSSDSGAWMTYTSLIGAKDLVEDEVLRFTPGIFQAVVPKAYEVRLTMVGTRAFAAKIHSQETELGKLDWRKAYHELKMEPTELPGEVIRSCQKVLDEIGLVFGCFDFIVTPQGDYVFLEVNEMGQFLFVEEYSGLPLLDAFSELLLQGKADYAFNAGRPRVRALDIYDRAATLARDLAQAHVQPPEAAFWEGERKTPVRS